MAELEADGEPEPGQEIGHEIGQEPSQAPAAHGSRTRRRWRAAARVATTLGTVVAAGVFLLLAVGPHVLGYRTVTMRSGSMAPAISPGDVVVIRPEPVADVRPGQVLTFAAPVAGAPVYTHRVVTVQQSGADVEFRTRGDANAAPDPWTARTTGSQAWHEVLVVPRLGWLVASLQHPLFRVLTVQVLPALVCLEVLVRLWRRPRRPDVDGVGTEAAPA